MNSGRCPEGIGRMQFYLPIVLLRLWKRWGESQIPDAFDLETNVHDIHGFSPAGVLLQIDSIPATAVYLQRTA